jgi:hypothetical protein
MQPTSQRLATALRRTSLVSVDVIGAEEPYDKLKRALRAEIDEAAWSCLYLCIQSHQPLLNRSLASEVEGRFMSASLA